MSLRLRMRKLKRTLAIAMCGVACASFAAELISDRAFVILRPQTSSFWVTATNSTMTVPIDFSSGATSAALDIRGMNYVKSYGDIVTNAFTFTLPEPDKPEAENVYDLTLMFDDGTVRTAKLGLIQGLMPGAEGMARCLAPSGGAKWSKIRQRAVLPIPYGMTTLKVNGVETDTGLGEAQGWHVLGGVKENEHVTLTMTVGDATNIVSLVGYGDGFVVIMK